jgi:hypothetical protein
MNISEYTSKKFPSARVTKMSWTPKEIHTSPIMVYLVENPHRLEAMRLLANNMAMGVGRDFALRIIGVFESGGSAFPDDPRGSLAAVKRATEPPSKYWANENRQTGTKQHPIVID